VVISDFDMTLTRFAYNGKRCPPSHNILNNSRLTSEECKAQLKDLLNTYHPIEIDSKQTAEEKLPLMVEWWTKAHTLLVQQRIRKDLLQDVVKESDAMLRELYQLFFDHLHEHSIPLLIFSAGLGDVLEEVILIYNKRERGNILQIGFLNDKVEERKTSYLNAYDIVLVKDETMEVPNALLLCFGVALPRTSS
uniref:5'-nucleotidase n=1 Tax=Oncorhynchus kisutch TaxID=8019 RepID=A0A8C7D9G7_ONCKI